MVFENSKIICTAESFLGLFNWTVACINGNHKQHSFSLLALEYIQVFSCLGFHLSPCLHAPINYYRLATTAFFCGPGYWHLVSQVTLTHICSNQLMFPL